MTGRHMTKALAAIIYAGFVTRETVCNALIVKALNEVEVECGNIMNIYIIAPCSEKILTVLGLEFRGDKGNYAMLTTASHGLKSRRTTFRKQLATCIASLEYKSCLANPGLWYRAQIDGHEREYHFYILYFVNDI